MQRTTSSVLVATSLCVVAACGVDRPTALTVAEPSVAPLAAVHPKSAGFITSQPLFAQTLVPQADVKAILTSGDLLPGSNEPWAPTPDGLGAYPENGKLIVYANHELTASGVKSTTGGTPFSFSRVSKLTIDPASFAIVDGSYVENGSSQLQRLCSATWVDGAVGFPSGFFLTGEETSPTANGSVVSAYSTSGARTALPWLGAFSHENQIAVPGFGKEIVSIGLDDSNGQSELYMYVAADEQAFLTGRGKLYVFRTQAKTAQGTNLHSGNLSDGQTITGEFAEIADPADLGSLPADRYNNLQKKVDALGAMPFVRIEDGDYAKGDGGDAPAIYFVDTGSPSVTGRAQVNANCFGVCDEAGSIYRMEFDPQDPTKNAKLTLVERSKGASLGWASPDNIATTRKSIMIQEDPAYAGFDGSRAPAIWNARFAQNGKKLVATTKVVQATQEQLIPGPNGKCNDAAGTCWETSGIISTEKWFGAGTWLFVVQAHTLPFSVTKNGVTNGYANEAGQLLVLRYPGS